ncbi:MAG: peptidyl-prolyl cis-trans isomerase [Burkholderiales bacterium]|nr:peptidyl-prolyl cis-trans isomerase [Burkholderiales bacterium]
MAANEHARPGLEEVRRVLLARASRLGMQGGEDEVIERLLEDELPDEEPGEDACRRYYEQNARRFTAGGLVEASHILFALTPRVPPERLRAKAAEVHALATREPASFARLAGEYSNCPSAAQGGSLGQLGRGDAVPEFEKAVLEGEALGVLPELVATRFGFHVVLVARRIPGRVLPYEEAKPQIAAFLRERGAERALGEYVRSLGAAGA